MMKVWYEREETTKSLFLCHSFQIPSLPNSSPEIRSALSSSISIQPLSSSFFSPHSYSFLFPFQHLFSPFFSYTLFHRLLMFEMFMFWFFICFFLLLYICVRTNVEKGKKEMKSKKKKERIWRKRRKMEWDSRRKRDGGRREMNKKRMIIMIMMTIRSLKSPLLFSSLIFFLSSLIFFLSPSIQSFLVLFQSLQFSTLFNFLLYNFGLSIQKTLPKKKKHSRTWNRYT